MSSLRPLAGFSIEALLRTGSRSALYRGRRLSDGASVLLERLRPGRVTTRARERLARERECLTRFDHPSIARLRAVVPDDDDASALVLEDPGGELLAREYPLGTIDLDSFLHVARSLASALLTVHEAGFVHRNVKLDRVLADATSGRVTLFNFGLAARADASRVRDELLGSPAYMAPEQTGRVALGVDHRTDHYGLGAALYQLLCGELPFPSEDPVELVHAHLAREPVPPSAYREGIPAELDRALLRLLDKEPRRRFRTLGPFVRGLERLRARTRGRADALERLPDARPPGRAVGPDVTRTAELSAPRLFDYEAAVRVANALSSELVLENLLEKLMWELLVHSGARRVVILLSDGERMLVEGHGGVNEPLEVLCALPLARFPAIARAPVERVMRERVSFVTADAQLDERLAVDPHVAARRVRSILCTPISRQGELIGTLYLENELAPGVFTEQRLALLNQLVVQIANAIENARLYDALDRARRDAITANETKSRFLLAMSHELRTPLNAVRGYADLLRDELEELAPGRFHEELDAIVASTERLAYSFSNILEFARASAGELDVATRECDALALVRALVDEHRALARAQGNALELHAPDVVPSLLLDADKLRFTLSGLLDNACRLTRSGRVDVQVSWRGESLFGRLRIEVVDTGPGLPERARARLFEPFMQADDSPTRTHEGCGLTLAIASRFCAAMGGALTVAPGDGRGARFVVELPCATA